jgi:hypothetical protein
VLRETHIFSSNCVNQFTAAINTLNWTQAGFAPGASGHHPNELGFDIRPQTNDNLALPEVRIESNGTRISTSGKYTERKVGWHLKEDLSWLRAGHGLRFGGEYRRFSETFRNGNNNGSFFFLQRAIQQDSTGFGPIGVSPAFANFLMGIPTTYFQYAGNRMKPEQPAFYLYGLDDWRIKSNLSINAGVRYEMAAPFRDKLDQVAVFRPGARSLRFPHAPSGILFARDPDPILGRVPRTAYRADKNNLAPRLGAGFSPAVRSGWLRRVLGEYKTAIRAGVGIYYDHAIGSAFSQFAFVQPFSPSEVFGFNASRSALGDPFGARINRWPLDLSTHPFTQSPQLRTIGPSFRTGYSYQYNLTIQREFTRGLLAEAAYVGSKSLNQERGREVNYENLLMDQSERLEPELGSVVSRESAGGARYDSLQLRLSRRGSRGLGFDAWYVYGKALDDASEAYLVRLDDKLGWSRSAYDRRHNFVLSYTYEIPTPVSHRLLKPVLDGWQLGGIAELRSGQPVEIVQVARLNGNRDVLAPVDLVRPFARLDPRRQRTVMINGIPRTGHFFFDPNSFQATSIESGSLGRNVFDGPGIHLWSISIAKKIRLGESTNLSLRSDIRNVFNRAHFSPPGNTWNISSPPFGQVQSAAPGRNVQLVLRLSF